MSNSNIFRQPVSRSATPSSRPTTPANAHSQPATPASAQSRLKSEFSMSQSQSGTPPPGTPASKNKYTDYRLRPIPAEEKEGKRFHVMKFYSRKQVDPTTFQVPVTMQRKDPRSLRYQQDMKDDENVKQEGGVKSEDGMASLAPDPDMLIAPDGNGRMSKKNLFQKKTRQVYTGHEEERQLRYEEHFPWLIEDFDGKNTWVGNYEAAQSDAYVLFVFDDDGFKMVPAEKWYKFTPRQNYKTLSLDEAEAVMAKKSKPPRWVMKRLHPEDENNEVVAQPKKKLKTVDGHERITRKREVDDDADELDYDEEFDDDEEAPIMEGPEDENREVEQRMKRQMRVKSEELGDDEAVLAEDRKIGRTGRELKKSLKSLENNAIYDSDDDEEEDPFNPTMSRPVFQPPEPSASSSGNGN